MINKPSKQSTSSHKLSFLATTTKAAIKAKKILCEQFEDHDPSEADVIITLGGDGFMLETLHKYLHLNVPFYGMNLGSHGFLLNEVNTTKQLLGRINKATPVHLYPLQMTTETVDGEKFEAIAINDVSLFRQTKQTAKLQITIDNKVRITELIADGAIIATPAGSTAYNLSVHGPILPLGSNIIALTPISAFRPRRWRGALLSNQSKIIFDVLEAEKRPVSVAADSTELRNVRQVCVYEDHSRSFTLLFDPEHNLEERIFAEQFAL
jgi:NAD+ kinase